MSTKGNLPKGIPLRQPDVTKKYSHIALEIQSGLASLRQDEICTDFEVVVRGQSFHCHKAVLASVSDYFRAMLQSGMKETVQNKSILDNISPEAFRVILDLLYLKSGDGDPLSNRGDDELSELLRVADMFQMKFLSKLCLELFAKTMAANNCIERWKIGRNSHSDRLRAMSWTYINGNFDSVAKESVMLSLDYDEFLPIISSDSLQVTDESSVWQVASDWIQFDRTKREDKLVELLKNCCLTEMEQTFLVEEISFDDSIRSDAVASKIVQRAIKFKYHPGDHGNVDLKFRECMGKEQVRMLLGASDGEDSISLLCYSARSQRWKVSPVRELRTVDFACCLHERDVYVSGGSGNHNNVMHKYSSTGDRWSLCGGRMPAGLKRHAMVATDNSLFLLGGCSGRTTNGEVFQFCLRSEKWNIHGEIIAPVINPSAVCLNDKIYIFGGVLNHEPIMAAASIQMYDTKTKTGTLLECQLPSPCAFSCATVRHEQIVVVTCNGEIVKVLGPSRRAAARGAIWIADKAVGNFTCTGSPLLARLRETGENGVALRCNAGSPYFKLSGRKLEAQLVATIPDFKGRKGFGLAMRGDKLSVYGGVQEDQDRGTVTNKVILADVISGKVWEGKPLPKKFIFYGSLSVIVESDWLQD